MASLWEAMVLRSKIVKRILFLLLSLILLLTGCITKQIDAPQTTKSPYLTENITLPDGEKADTSNVETAALSPKVDVDGVKIALLDTGVSTKAIDNRHILPGHNYVTGTEDTEDLINHGTAVASVILGCDGANVTGIAPEEYIIPLVIVTKQDGKTTSVSPEQLAQAIVDSIDIYKADIINVSLGIHEDNRALREAISYAEQKDVLIISAVGNDGENGKPYYPAAYDTVLAVGACDRDGNRASFSQDGAQVLAPGDGIMLASRNGVAYGVKGTSFATGYISAYAAKILAKEPTLTAKDLYNKIIDEADRLVSSRD